MNCKDTAEAKRAMQVFAQVCGSKMTPAGSAQRTRVADRYTVKHQYLCQRFLQEDSRGALHHAPCWELATVHIRRVTGLHQLAGGSIHTSKTCEVFILAVKFRDDVELAEKAHLLGLVLDNVHMEI